MNYGENAECAVSQHGEQGDLLRTLASFVQIAIEYGRDLSVPPQKQIDWLYDVRDMLVLTDTRFELKRRDDDMSNDIGSN